MFGRRMAKPGFKGLTCTLACSWLNGLVLGYEVNCDYFDASRRDKTSYLQCHENGCCGEFKDRYCCVGPVVTVVIIFGALIGALIIFVIVGVCYSKYKAKQKHRVQVVPTIVADSYRDIPLPSPRVGAPPVYNTARLHPPAFTPQPFKNFKSFDNKDIHPPPSNLHPPRLHILK